MGQQEVYDFLKKNKGKWFTSKEIAHNINVSTGSVTNNLAKLRKSKAVNYKSSEKRANFYLYQFAEN